MTEPPPFQLSWTNEFRRWHRGLRDLRSRTRIAEWVNRLSTGNFGNAKSLGSGLYELKIDFEPGYRVYFFRKGNEIIYLLAGGDKSSQHRDIEKARRMRASLDGE